MSGTQQLPRGWTWVNLGELVGYEPNSLTDGPFGSNLKTEHYTDSGPRVIRLQNIGDAVFRDVIACISKDHFAKLQKHAVKPGDIVIAAFGDPAPRACIVPDIGPAIVKADCIRFKPTGELNPAYLMYALNSPDVQKRTTAKVHGVGRPRINLKEIRAIELPIAPAEEQKRVVAEIEALLSDLDAAVTALKRVQQNLKRYRASVLKAACEGRLVPTEAELARKEGRFYETGEQLLARILKERRAKWEAAQLAKMIAAGKPPKDDKWKQKYVEPGVPDSSDLPVLPSGWTWATVEQVGEVVTGFTPSTHVRSNFGGDLPFVKPTDLDVGYFVRGARETLSATGASIGRCLPAGTVLVTCIGATIGKIGFARVPCATNQQINAWVPYPVRFLAEWGYWWFTSLSGQRLIRTNASATTLPILNKSKFAALPFPLPPAHELERIAGVVEERIISADSIETDLDRSYSRAERLRQSILRRAFEGKMVPQDTNDEPASVLLERIRAERSIQTDKRRSRRIDRAAAGLG